MRDGHLLITLPGNESSLIFARMMREARLEKNVMFGEAASIPYACRIVGASKVQQKMDDERIEIAKKLGFKDPMSFVRAINLWYGIKADSIYDFSQTTPVHNAFGHDAPKSPKERYISEDTPFVLVPMHEYAMLTGVADPAFESIINIAGIYNDENYFETGRTLEKMDLAGMSIQEIIAYAETGIWQKPEARA